MTTTATPTYSVVRSNDHDHLAARRIGAEAALDTAEEFASVFGHAYDVIDSEGNVIRFGHFDPETVTADYYSANGAGWDNA